LTLPLWSLSGPKEGNYSNELDRLRILTGRRQTIWPIVMRSLGVEPETTWNKSNW